MEHSFIVISLHEFIMRLYVYVFVFGFCVKNVPWHSDKSDNSRYIYDDKTNNNLSNTEHKIKLSLTDVELNHIAKEQDHMLVDLPACEAVVVVVGDRLVGVLSATRLTLC